MFRERGVCLTLYNNIVFIHSHWSPGLVGLHDRVEILSIRHSGGIIHSVDMGCQMLFLLTIEWKSDLRFVKYEVHEFSESDERLSKDICQFYSLVRILYICNCMQYAITLGQSYNRISCLTTTLCNWPQKTKRVCTTCNRVVEWDDQTTALVLVVENL